MGVGWEHHAGRNKWCAVLHVGDSNGFGDEEDDTDEVALIYLRSASESWGAPTLSLKNPGRRVLTGIFILGKGCSPESFLFMHNAKRPPRFQSTKKKGVILSPFYPTRTTLNASTKPSGDKNGEGSSQDFTSCKRPCVIKEHFLLGPRA